MAPRQEGYQVCKLLLMVNVTISLEEYNYLLAMLRQREEDLYWSNDHNPKRAEDRIMLGRLIGHLEGHLTDPPW